MGRRFLHAYPDDGPHRARSCRQRRGAAPRRARIGPTVSSIAIEDGAGGSQSFTSFGGTLAFLSGDDGEIGVGISRYGNLSSSSCVRQMTFVGFESNYYPIGAKGVAPFASSAVGLARVLDQDPLLQFQLLGCNTSAQTTNELGLGFGLGVRVNLGNQAAALVEGRFFQVPNSAIKALEGRANVSFAFGSPNKKTQLLNGTLGPAVGVLTPLSGALEGRGPTVGVRFRREQKKGGSLGLQIDYAPLRVRTGCSANCDPYAILFARDMSLRCIRPGDACTPRSDCCSQASRRSEMIAAWPRVHTAGSAPTSSVAGP